MLDKEPLWYPSRNQFPTQPGVPDKQLWAIGMVVVQWSAVEWFMDMSTRQLIGDDQAVLAEYEKVRGFQLKLAFWKAQLELKGKDPARSNFLALIPRMQALSTQRDEVVHRLWGGGMEGTSPAAAGLETTEGGLLPKPGEKFKGKPPRIPFSWKASFIRLRRMAMEMSALNRDLFQAGMFGGAPHVYVDIGGQVSGG
jgi:hypothetical protein